MALSLLSGRAEKRLRCAVNPALYTREEFDTKLRVRGQFLASVLAGVWQYF